MAKCDHVADCTNVRTLMEAGTLTFNEGRERLWNQRSLLIDSVSDPEPYMWVDKGKGFWFVALREFKAVAEKWLDRRHVTCSECGRFKQETCSGGGDVHPQALVKNCKQYKEC